MKSARLATIAFAAAMGMAAPSFGQVFMIPPPSPDSLEPLLPPRPASNVVLTEDRAEADLHALGVSKLRGLGLIGDYWEAEGVYRGEPVAAYLFEDGKLVIRHYPAGALIQAFGTLPETGSFVASTR